MSFGIKNKPKESEKESSLSLVSYIETDESDRYYNEEEILKHLGVKHENIEFNGFGSFGQEGKFCPLS